MEKILGWTEGDVRLDTKGLEVGQVVLMTSGFYACWGDVVKVTPDGAVVRSEIHAAATPGP